MANEEEKKPSETRQPQRISIPIDMNFIYVNGGNVGLTPTEVQLTATVNGRPQALIVFPLPVAKSVAGAMLQAIKDYEERTGVNIPDLNHLANSLKK